MKHAWNYIDCDFDLSPLGCATQMVAQPGVGLRPDRWVGTGPARGRHSTGSRSDLSRAPAPCTQHLNPSGRWGQAVGNIVSEWTQILGLVLMTKRLIEVGSKAP